MNDSNEINYCTSSDQFDAIRLYLVENSIELLITDYNGVLDNYYNQKKIFFLNVLGDNKKLLADLWVHVEKEYLKNNTVGIGDSIKLFFAHRDLVLSGKQERELVKGIENLRITQEATHFLDDLEIDFIIYTSLNEPQLLESMGDKKYAKYTRDDASEGKPSSVNIVDIVQKYNIDISKVCVLGDGLTDDVMPAKLLGAHTILVSPYVSMIT